MTCQHVAHLLRQNESQGIITQLHVLQTAKHHNPALAVGSDTGVTLFNYAEFHSAQPGLPLRISLHGGLN